METHLDKFIAAQKPFLKYGYAHLLVFHTEPPEMVISIRGLVKMDFKVERLGLASRALSKDFKNTGFSGRGFRITIEALLNQRDKGRELEPEFPERFNSVLEQAAQWYVDARKLMVDAVREKTLPEWHLKM